MAQIILLLWRNHVIRTETRVTSEVLFGPLIAPLGNGDNVDMMLLPNCELRALIHIK